MGRGSAKSNAGEADGLEARKKALEKELHDVEEKLAAQQLAREKAGDEPGTKKGKKDKPAKEKKEKKVKKAKAPKAHPSSKAGPGACPRSMRARSAGLSVALTRAPRAPAPRAQASP